ncbi:MAG: GDP-mannose 4,6-dehydratase [Acidobacteriota bacterium]|nr:GDP-mannose 4,6-dehydratase [Acidobacteriota bacterium]
MPFDNLRGAPVLVTGGAGFIGSHLVDALLELDCAVRVLDDFSTGRESNLAHCRHRIELVRGDLRHARTVALACEERRFVFHQGALGSVPRSMEDPATTVAVNVGGTANVFAGARDAGVERVVYASSSSVYGDSERLPKVEGEEGRPLSPYALSKKMNEDLAEMFVSCFGMELIGLRYFNVYGPRQRPDGPYAAVIPRFFAAAVEGRAPVIYGDGEQSRDFTFVADAVRANLLAAVTAEIRDHVAVNVASGRQTSINELARELFVVSGSPVPANHQAERPGDVRHSLADLARAHAALGYSPETDLTAGLAQTLPHYQAVPTGGAA